MSTTQKDDSKTTEQAPDMNKQMLEMMASLQTEIAELKANKPVEAIVDVDDLTKRKQEHNKQLRLLVEAQKKRFEICFGYEESDQAMVPPEMRDESVKRKDMLLQCYREVVLQMMWVVATSSKRQYMYSRYRADSEYLKLNRIAERLGTNTRRESDGLNPMILESTMNPNADYERSERTYDYFNNNMYPYEILCIAAREVWEEIIEEKQNEHYASGTDYPFRMPNEPDARIEETDYIAYLEAQASKREFETINDGADALGTARLLRMTRLLQEKSE